MATLAKNFYMNVPHSGGFRQFEQTRNAPLTIDMVHFVLFTGEVHPLEFFSFLSEQNS